MNYRQGDVFLTKVDNFDLSSVDPKPIDARGLVLADGETSMHHHAVFGSGAKLFNFRDNSSRQLLVTGDLSVDLRVVGGASGGAPRHTPIVVPPGVYIVRTQRSWTSASVSRSVED